MLIGAEGSSAAGQDDDEPMLQAVHRLGHLYANQDKLDEAEMYRRALEGKEKALGHDHTSTLATATDLGTLYADQGKLDEAEEMCWRALAGYEKALGRDHTSTLRTVNNLGNLYADQGKLDKAEEMYIPAGVPAREHGRNRHFDRYCTVVFRIDGFWSWGEMAISTLNERPRRDIRPNRASSATEVTKGHREKRTASKDTGTARPNRRRVRHCPG